MPIVSLTQQERDKFSSYLEQEAETNTKLVEQLKPFQDTLQAIKRLAQDAIACAHVASMLQSVESQTIGEG